MQIKTKTLIVGANARTINQSVGKVTSAYPTDKVMVKLEKDLK